MSIGFENSAQTHDSSTDSLELRHNHDQEQKMDAQEKDFSSSEVTHQSVNAQVKQLTYPIFSQVEKLCALLSDRNELDTTGKANLPFRDVIRHPQAQRQPVRQVLEEKWHIQTNSK